MLKRDYTASQILRACLFLYFKSIFFKIEFFSLLQINFFVSINCFNVNNDFLKYKKYIILIQFRVKNTLKNNRYHTFKYLLSTEIGRHARIMISRDGLDDWLKLDLTYFINIETMKS